MKYLRNIGIAILIIVDLFLVLLSIVSFSNSEQGAGIVFFVLTIALLIGIIRLMSRKKDKAITNVVDDSPVSTEPDSKPESMLEEQENITLAPVSVDEIKLECDQNHKAKSELFQKYVAFSGWMYSISREDALKAVTDRGGYPQEWITKDTNILVLGNTSNTSAKEKIAQKNGIPIINEDEFIHILEDSVGDGESIPLAFKNLETTIKTLEELPESAQKILKEAICQAVYRTNESDESVFLNDKNDIDKLTEKGFLVSFIDEDRIVSKMPISTIRAKLKEMEHPEVKARSKEKLIELMHIYLSPNEWDDFLGDGMVVILSQPFKLYARKTYTYLKRKFDTESYYDDNTGEFKEVPYGTTYSVSVDLLSGVSELSNKLPEDEITNLLKKYNKDTSRQNLNS